MLFIRQIINCLNLLKPRQKYICICQKLKLISCQLVIAITTKRPHINPHIDYKIT